MTTCPVIHHHHSELKEDKDGGSTIFFFQRLQSKFHAAAPWLIRLTIPLTPSPSRSLCFSSMPWTLGLRTWKLNSTKKNLKKSSTKFYWCISALPSNISAQLTHLIWDLGEDPHQGLKEHLTTSTASVIIRYLNLIINLSFTSNTRAFVLMSSMLNRISFSLVYSSPIYPNPSETI